MQKVYSRINWENEPSTNTPLSEDNLNRMDYALDKIDDRVVQLSGYEERTKESEINAKISEDNAKESELNAKMYAEQAKESEENVGDLLVPKGDITFEELSTVDAKTGYMYKITDNFFTDDTFADGSGKLYLGGTKVYLNKDGLWELLTSTSGGGSESNDIAIPLLAGDWVEDESGKYTQRVFVVGLTEDSNPIIVANAAGRKFTREELEAFKCLTNDIFVEEGYITFTAKEIPSMSLTVIAKGVSATGDTVATVSSLIEKYNALAAKATALENEISTTNDNVDTNTNAISNLSSDLETLSNNSFMNYYTLIAQQIETQTPTHTTYTLLANRKISDYDYILAYALPTTSRYARGFTILPKLVFNGASMGECNMEGWFSSGGTIYYVDIKYVSDTQISISTDYPYKLTIRLEGIKIGRL